MPTATLKKFRSRLADLNDQICYSHFSDEEAHDSIHAASDQSPDLLTTQVFPTNPYSARIDVQCSELPEFREKANLLINTTAFVLATEYLLGYIKSVQKFRSLVTRTLADALTDKKPEEQIARKLEAWGQAPHTALTKTIRYLRLRRNHLAHANDLPHRSLSSLIRKHAKSMTEYWADQPTRLPAVNFSSGDFSKLSVQETLSMLNLCRVCMVKIDESIVASFPPESLETFEATEFALKKGHLRALSSSDIFRKFSAHFEFEYQRCIRISESDFSRIWEKVGQET